MSEDTLVALESFIGSVDGKEDRFFREGELVRRTDPAVKKWPEKFGAARYLHDVPVEQATQGSG